VINARFPSASVASNLSIQFLVYLSCDLRLLKINKTTNEKWGHTGMSGAEEKTWPEMEMTVPTKQKTPSVIYSYMFF
jgi:hypothetical protein